MYLHPSRTSELVKKINATKGSGHTRIFFLLLLLNVNRRYPSNDDNNNNHNKRILFSLLTTEIILRKGNKTKHNLNKQETILEVQFKIMAPLINDETKGDFKDKQFAEHEVADKVVEQCK
jgi:hypothetical protein